MNKNTTRTTISFSEKTVSALNDMLNAKTHAWENENEKFDVSLVILSLNATVSCTSDELTDVYFIPTIRRSESFDVIIDATSGQMHNLSNRESTLEQFNMRNWNLISALCGQLISFITATDTGPVFDEEKFISHLENKA